LIVTRLKVLLVHNRYQQYGGEDAVVDVETKMLREAGHKVETFFVTNDRIIGARAKLTAAALTPYNPMARRALRKRLQADRPDIVHVHNFFPQLSPSIFDACIDERVPVVMTMHNFRIGCSNAFLFRDGKPCEDCLTGSAYHAVQHRCYRSSRLGSLAVASMIAYHRRVGTWQHKVTRFIALTDFSRGKLVQAGLPTGKVVVKPNFVADPLDSMAVSSPGAGAVFIGRLSPEKGGATLIEAWQGINLPLRIVGDGPEADELRRAAPANVTFVGHRQRADVYREIAGAAFVIVPSIWYENFPVTVIEAMAMGKPILASRIGALQEIVTEGVTGLHFQPGDAADLRHAVARLANAPELSREMGENGRRLYLDKLSPAKNLNTLIDIYSAAIAEGRLEFASFPT
jgi:glycosyltransferase involved in cell wall biosynthesis